MLEPVVSQKEALEAEKKRLAELNDHLGTFTEEDKANVVKIQSSMRGKQARKQVQSLKSGLNATTVLPALHSYSAEEELACVKIQANARGMMTRKQVRPQSGYSVQTLKII